MSLKQYALLALLWLSCGMYIAEMKQSHDVLFFGFVAGWVSIKAFQIINTKQA